VACSGSTTSAITLGRYNEGAQLDKVTSDTKLITMTIGGNDMPFADFAEACIRPGSGSCDKRPYRNAIAGISNNVIPGVERMLNAVRDRLISLHSNATVLVVGYPYLVPQDWVFGAVGCWWLQPQEPGAIREVTNTLNTAIRNEVNAVGGKFHFVSATASGSPFIGHELCRRRTDTAPRYFTNYDSSVPEVYTFHPNGLGQQAYADLITAYLAQHPLS
jgi:lysophospholipase L1-like esterase